MKHKFLLLAILFFYCFNSFAQDNLKSLQNNNGNSNSNSSMGGCYSYWSTWFHYTSFPPADSILPASSMWDLDTIYVPGIDSIILHAEWDAVQDCGPLGYGIWFRDSIAIDTIYSINSQDIYLTIQQPGNYHSQLFGYFNNLPSAYTRGATFINTNSTTSIFNQTNPKLNVSVIKNKIIIKDLLEKDNLILSVYDLTGRSVFNKEIISTASSFEIEMPSFTNGLYILNLKNKDFSFLKKFNTSNF